MLEKRPNPFEGAQIKCGSQTFLQNDIKLKLPWRPQDIRDARAVGYLLRKAANREWNQPKRKKFVAVNTNERSWRSEESFVITHGDAELRVCPASFWPYFGPVFPHLFWNGNLCPVMLDVCELLFYFDFIGDYS